MAWANISESFLIHSISTCNGLSHLDFSLKMEKSFIWVGGWVAWYFSSKSKKTEFFSLGSEYVASILPKHFFFTFQACSNYLGYSK